MDIMMANSTNYIEEFVSVLENTSAQKFLRANPYTKTDGVDFNGKVSEELFFNHFYVETAASKEKISEIRYLIANSPESTIIIRGYSGCGKTTFLHDLLYNYLHKYNVIDCEKGIDNQDEDPILTKITFDLIDTINKDIINNQAKIFKTLKQVFFDNYINSMAVGRFLDGKMLSHKFLRAFFDEDRYEDTIDRINQGDELAKNDMAQILLAHLSALHGMQRLFLLVAWDISTNISQESNDIGNIFCIDNLDNVESDKIRKFLEYYTQFWINLINAFSEFDLAKWNIDGYTLIQKYAFILVLRETTYAKLSEHFNGQEKGMVEEIVADKIYSDCNVFVRRNKFLEDNKDSIPQRLLQDVKQIDLILSDRYIRKNLLALFNNDNNTAIRTLCVIQNEDSSNKNLLGYIRALRPSSDVRGPYGIVLFLLLNYFKSKFYFDEHLMLYNFKQKTENQPYKYSASRLLLSYLSNFKEPVSLGQIFSYFDGIINLDDISHIFFQIYQLRFSNWRHLITFIDTPPVDYKWITTQTELYEKTHEKNDERYAKVQITEAGRMYLRTIAPHFEFYSVRIDNSLPLFCSSFKSPNSFQKYNSIIDRVYNAVNDCNQRIYDTVNDICRIRKWTYAEYIHSKFMYINPTSGNKQFHGERVIFSHIGYINAFRKYVILCEDIPKETRASLNKAIASSINRYLTLYQSNICLKSGTNDTVYKILSAQTSNVIRNSSDFSLPIEIEYDDDDD